MDWQVKYTNTKHLPSQITNMSVYVYVCVFVQVKFLIDVLLSPVFTVSSLECVVCSVNIFE